MLFDIFLFLILMTDIAWYKSVFIVLIISYFICSRELATHVNDTAGRLVYYNPFIETIALIVSCILSFIILHFSLRASLALTVIITLIILAVLYRYHESIVGKNIYVNSYPLKDVIASFLNPKYQPRIISLREYKNLQIDLFNNINNATNNIKKRDIESLSKEINQQIMEGIILLQLLIIFSTKILRGYLVNFKRSQKFMHSLYYYFLQKRSVEAINKKLEIWYEDFHKEKTISEIFIKNISKILKISSKKGFKNIKNEFTYIVGKFTFETQKILALDFKDYKYAYWIDQRSKDDNYNII